MNIFEESLRTYLKKADICRVRNVRIGIGGAGGLGSNIATLLVRSGFRNFKIIDLDIVEASNLNRQFYFYDDIGKPKAEILKKHLLKINPDLDIEARIGIWSPGTAGDFFNNRDVIVEAFDKPGTKREFVEFYHDKTSFMISGNGMAGTLRKETLRVTARGNIYFVGDGMNDIAADMPPMAPRVTACAAMMAEVILDLALSGKIGKTNLPSNI